MVVTVFLLDKDFEIQAVLDNKISWEYTKAVNKATEISVALPREDFAATSKSNLTKIAQYIQIYSDGLYTIGGKVIKRDITDNTVTLMALTEECKMESVLCPAQYGRKYEDYDLADVVRDLNKGWYTQRIKSNTQWDTSIDSSNIDSSSMTNAILLTKGSNGIYNSDGYATYRFQSTDVANFSSWDRIRWLSDNHAQTDEGVIELISTTVQYRYGATAATMGGWSAPIVGALPDTLGLSIETITDAIVDVRINLHTDDLTSEGPEGDIIGTTPVVFALEVIARTEAYIGTTHIPANAGVLVKSLDADGTSAFELLTASCEMVGWEFEVYDNQIYIAETLGHDLTESFVFRKEENIRITELSDSDEELVNVLIANGTGSGINRPSITLRDDASIAEYGEYPMVQEFDTETISELTTMAQDYLDEHKAIEFNWRVDTFDSIDSTVTGDIVFEEAIAFHRLYSNSAFTVPSSNRAEQNLFFYNPLYTAGDTIRIIDPLQGTLIDSRILEERRTGDETGIHVSLYLNKARNVLVSRVARPAKINPLSAPYTIIAKPIVNGVVLTVSSSSERHRWADTQIFMSETSPVVCDVPVITGRTGTFTITELSPDKRYYFVAKYVDNNRDVSAQSNEVSCQPLIMGDLTELLIQANTTVINITARNVLQTPTIVFKIKNVIIPIGNVTVARSDGGSLTQIDSTTYSMDCSTVSVPSISVTADATYDGKDYTSSVVIVVEKALLAPVDNFAGTTLVPEESLDGGDLLKGDYFLWTGVTTATHPKVEHEVDEDALVYGEIYEYERTSPGMWQKSINGDLVMTLFDSFAKLDVDVESTVIGNAVIKRLIAINAFIKNLKVVNLDVVSELMKPGTTEEREDFSVRMFAGRAPNEDIEGDEGESPEFYIRTGNYDLLTIDDNFLDGADGYKKKRALVNGSGDFAITDNSIYIRNVNADGFNAQRCNIHGNVSTDIFLNPALVLQPSARGIEQSQKLEYQDKRMAYDWCKWAETEGIPFNVLHKCEVSEEVDVGWMMFVTNTALGGWGSSEVNCGVFFYKDDGTRLYSLNSKSTLVAYQVQNTWIFGWNWFGYHTEYAWRTGGFVSGNGVDWESFETGVYPSAGSKGIGNVVNPVTAMNPADIDIVIEDYGVHLRNEPNVVVGGISCDGFSNSGGQAVVLRCYFGSDYDMYVKKLPTYSASLPPGIAYRGPDNTLCIMPGA